MDSKFILPLLIAGLAAGQANAPTPTPSRIEINVEQKIPGGVKAMDPEHIFEQGDLVRFRVKTNFAGYLYVMNKSTSGKYALLFPKNETGQQNKISSGKEYVVPATENGWFRIEGPPGHEIVYWLVSPSDFQKPYSSNSNPIPPTAPIKPGALPDDITPRCDDTVFQANGDCVDTSAGPKPVTKNDSVPDDLAKYSSSQQTGDLLFLKDQKVSMISSPEPLIAPVIYQFHLAHK